jgi:hypothetical protein
VQSTIKLINNDSIGNAVLFLPRLMDGQARVDETHPYTPPRRGFFIGGDIFTNGILT